jgi:hypothetical protein
MATRYIENELVQLLSSLSMEVTRHILLHKVHSTIVFFYRLILIVSQSSFLTAKK